MAKEKEPTVEFKPKGVPVKQFCAEVGISDSTFWKYSGLIKHYRVGEKVLVWASEIERVMHEGLPSLPKASAQDDKDALFAPKKPTGTRGARARKPKAEDATNASAIAVPVV